MKIVFIGAGNLATNLAKALRSLDYEIEQVYSRTMESACALASMVGAEAVTDLGSVSADADLYILSVKDGALADVVGSLCRPGMNGVFVHTAGSIPMGVFSGHASRYGVFYPMQSFSKQKAVDFSVVPFFLEASGDDVMAMLDTLAHRLTPKVYHISSDARKHLHLAAVFACNFVNHCYELSAEVLRKYDIPFDVMLPLIDETAGKVHSIAPKEAQTGPAIRYDRNVIEMQAGLLADSPRLLEIYKLLSDSIHTVAAEGPTTQQDNETNNSK